MIDGWRLDRDGSAWSSNNFRVLCFLVWLFEVLKRRSFSTTPPEEDRSVVRSRGFLVKLGNNNLQVHRVHLTAPT